jgi:hypothetical protein
MLLLHYTATGYILMVFNANTVRGLSGVRAARIRGAYVPDHEGCGRQVPHGSQHHPLLAAHYWRHIGYGPKGIKVGRQILYSIAEINRFERALADRPAKESA